MLRSTPKARAKQFKIFFLTTMNAGIGYYRMHAFQKSLNRRNKASVAMPWYHPQDDDIKTWQFHVHDDPRVYARTGVLNMLCREADVVVVQYLHSWESLAMIEALKACHPNTVFLTEIDDDVLNTPPWNDAFEQYQPGWKFRDIIVEQIKALDGVIVTTSHLKEIYSEFNKHVYVVPNAIDLEVWDKIKNDQKKSEIRIGWVGGSSHRSDLETIHVPLKQVLAETKGVSFYCLHGAPDFFKNQSKIVCVREFKNIDRYPKWVAKYGFDIGIAPLFDCSFNRGKSNLRKLEYGGLKIPVVAANVGHFAETVKHGRDGFLYDNAEQFKACLHKLIKDEQLRKLMGKFNYLDVKHNFSTDVVADHYLSILKEAHALGQTTKVDVTSMAPKTTENQWIAQPPAPSLP